MYEDEQKIRAWFQVLRLWKFELILSHFLGDSTLAFCCGLFQE